MSVRAEAFVRSSLVAEETTYGEQLVDYIFMGVPANISLYNKIISSCNRQPTVLPPRQRLRRRPIVGSLREPTAGESSTMFRVEIVYVHALQSTHTVSLE